MSKVPTSRTIDIKTQELSTYKQEKEHHNVTYGQHYFTPFTLIASESTCSINTIRFKCTAECINLWSLSDSVQFEHLDTLRCYAGERVMVQRSGH